VCNIKNFQPYGKNVRKPQGGFFDSNCIAYAIARSSVRLSVTRVYHTKTVEVRIMELSPYGSPIPLVFAG